MVLVVLGVLVTGAALGVSLVVIVLNGIRGEHAQWPVSPASKRVPPRSELAGGAEAGSRTAGTGGRDAGEHPEWTARDLAGDDLRPVGTHEEKHALPGRARWW